MKNVILEHVRTVRNGAKPIYHDVEVSTDTESQVIGPTSHDNVICCKKTLTLSVPYRYNSNDAEFREHMEQRAMQELAVGLYGDIVTQLYKALEANQERDHSKVSKKLFEIINYCMKG